MGALIDGWSNLVVLEWNMEKAEVLSAFSASMSTACLLLDIWMYQQDLGRREMVNTEEQQLKEVGYIQRQGNRLLSPKGAEKVVWFYARLVPCVKNFGDKKFLLTLERLTLHDFFKKGKEKLGTSHRSLERTCCLGNCKQEIRSTYSDLPKVDHTSQSSMTKWWATLNSGRCDSTWCNRVQH